MLRIFRSELENPENFVVTLELVPGREAFGRDTDTLVTIARDAFEDGRVSAVSITDNPGGNPALSPDVLGYEIFKLGMDVIVHFTCRDMNRVGMESRALQLARMGMKNILALTGDYSGKGFGGRGTPVFDLDSVQLTRMLNGLGERLVASGDPDPFFTGCAVSPFKNRRAECIAQYRKLDKKIAAGAQFVITQLGYDVYKFRELIEHHREHNPRVPMMASVYLLSPRAARAMNRGRVPGAHVSDALYEQVVEEWREPRRGLDAAVERAARLAVVLQGLGYRGIHIGGIHRSFQSVAAILDRMAGIREEWPRFYTEMAEGREAVCCSCYQPDAGGECDPEPKSGWREKVFEHLPYRVLDFVHHRIFDRSSLLAPACRMVAAALDAHGKAWVVKRCLEDPVKVPLLSCQSCGDCGIQHAAFLCPESRCPKHTRNGPCGGSREGHCEVYPEKLCIWVRAYTRLERAGRLPDFLADDVPPRMWELNRTSAWVNFHLKRDHQG